MKKVKGNYKSKKGFTLIELLAVIVILAIIAAIAVPAVLNIVEDSKSVRAAEPENRRRRTAGRTITGNGG